MVLSARSRLAAVAMFLPLTASCGRPAFNGTAYRDAEVAFRVGPIPRTWRRIDVDRSKLAFRDDTAAATVAVNARCGRDGDDVPLESLTQHLFLEFTERQLIGQRRFMLDGREAMRTELVAKLDGVPKHFVVVVLKKDGCVYDFLLIDAVGVENRSMPAFDRFVTGFATVSDP